MYRIGKKQKRALLTADGHEVVVFNKGQEALAEKVCNLLNAELEANKISSSAVLKEGVCRCFEPIKLIDVFDNLRCGWCNGIIKEANSLL